MSEGNYSIEEIKNRILDIIYFLLYIYTMKPTY